ncbi:MAG TPA: hypothetical protein VIV11_06340 [Kofleriaceae bacterium]
MRPFVRITLALSLVGPVAGCIPIEGPEPEALRRVTPHPCETGLSADQTFLFESNFPTAKLQTDPPQFVLELALGGDAETIPMTTSVGEFGELLLQPVMPLPPDTDMLLRMVDAGVVEGALVETDLPARYSTRNAPAIRTYRAIENRVFVSFTQRLDAASVKTSVTVRQGGAAIASDATYLDAPDRVVWVEILSDPGSIVDVVFSTGLRTDRGDAVFATETSVQLDPAYTLPPDNGCQFF